MPRSPFREIEEPIDTGFSSHPNPRYLAEKKAAAEYRARNLAIRKAEEAAADRVRARNMMIPGVTEGRPGKDPREEFNKRIEKGLGVGTLEGAAAAFGLGPLKFLRGLGMSSAPAAAAAVAGDDPENAAINAGLVALAASPKGALSGLLGTGAAYATDAEAGALPRMLQMMYRGRTSQVVPDEARAMYLSPQRKYAENYALRRARQNGGAPVIDTYMVDPFNVERRYHNMLPEKGQNLTSNIAYPKPGEYEHVGFDVLDSGGFAHGGPVHLAKGGALNRIRQALSGPRSRATEIVKEPGGQWLTGSVEGALRPLKRTVEGVDITPDMIKEHMEVAGVDLAPRYAVNKWIEGPLTKYVKNRMATKDDEIRQLAEEGVLHFEPQAGVGQHDSVAFANRMKAGYPTAGAAQSDLAKRWEEVSDFGVTPMTAAHVRDVREVTPTDAGWLSKLPPDAPVHEVGRRFPDRQGFDHLLDVIREDLGTGRLRPENLNKLSVKDAVRRAAEYNAEKARAMEAKRLADMAGIPVHKEYPENNPLGLKWVELRAPDTLPEGYSLRHEAQREGPGGYRALDASGKPVAFGATEQEAAYQANRPTLQNWLKQEGDAMGHCVGGYCDDVLSGRIKIYSLRDAKGEPHVTIEARPGKQLTEADLPDSVRDQLADFEGSQQEFEALVQKSLAENQIQPRIVQIKGKHNRAPNPEYLPFVQDFVRSGKWSDVGDLQNTGLKHFKEPTDLGAGITIQPGYHSQEDIKKLLQEGGVPEANVSGWLRQQGFAHGGSVETPAPPSARDVVAQLLSFRL